MSRVWFTDKLSPQSGTFDTEWRFGADTNVTDHATTETDAITADPAGELWVYRDDSWRPVSKLGLYATAITDNSLSLLSTPCIGYPIVQDVITATVQNAAQSNVGQVRANGIVTLPSTGVYFAWLYVRWDSPTDTAPELSLSMGATTIAHQVYDQATTHAMVSGLYVATTGGTTVTFDYGTTERPAVIRTVTAKLSDYEA